jgi:hypothetical protein
MSASQPRTANASDPTSQLAELTADELAAVGGARRRIRVNSRPSGPHTVYPSSPFPPTGMGGGYAGGMSGYVPSGMSPGGLDPYFGAGLY